MNLAQQVFNRVEKKYILQKEEYEELMNKIEKYIKKNPYYFNTICNVYYDTRNYDLIRNSIEKPIYKEKVRIRSYGVPKLEDKVFLEIKKKYDGIVNKRRIEITLKEAYEYLEENKLPTANDQIAQEIDYCFKHYNLQPSMFIAYERYSYLGKEDENFRITFDTKIRSRDYDLRLEQGSYGKNLISDDMYIMEAKTLGALPLWFVKALSELQIYPGNFSKYGNVYKSNVTNSNIA